MTRLVVWMCGHYRSGYVQHFLRRGCCPSCGETEIREMYLASQWDFRNYPRLPPRRRDSA